MNFTKIINICICLKKCLLNTILHLLFLYVLISFIYLFIETLNQNKDFRYYFNTIIFFTKLKNYTIRYASYMKITISIVIGKYL